MVSLCIGHLGSQLALLTDANITTVSKKSELTFSNGYIVVDRGASARNCSGEYLVAVSCILRRMTCGKWLYIIDKFVFFRKKGVFLVLSEGRIKGAEGKKGRYG